MTQSVRVDEVPKSRTIMPPNCALERSVTGWVVGAAGAREMLAPTAARHASPLPAQRGP